MTVAGPPAYLSRTAIAMLALAAGVAIANGYALQPSLSAIAGDFGVSAARMATLASVTMLGYLAGLALLVPLVDRFGPRTLIPAQMGGARGVARVRVAVVDAARARHLLRAGGGRHHGRGAMQRGGRQACGAASAGRGDGRGFRGHFRRHPAEPFRRRRVVAVVRMAGRAARAGRQRHAATIGAIPRLLRDSAALRRRTGAGMLWFFAFNLVWVGLAIRLAAPPYSMGAAAIGAYSLAGVLGLGVTRVAGKLTDRFGDRAVIGWGLAVAALSTLLLGVALGHPGWLGVGLAWFDAGCFAAQVANQARVVAIQPARAGALSAAYLTLYYAAGAGGAVAAGMLVERIGWGAMMFVAAIALAAAGWVGAARVSVDASGEPTSAG